MYIVLMSGMSIVILVMLVFYVFGGFINLVLIVCMMVVGWVLVLKVVFFIVVESVGGKDVV